MERVKNIFGTFFDINTFSIKRIIASIAILIAFYLFKGLLTNIILKLFKVPKENRKTNSFYRPLKSFFGCTGLYIALLVLNPIATCATIINKLYRIVIIALCTFGIANLVAPKSKFERELKKRMHKTNDAMVKMICKTLKILAYVLGSVILISELGYNISGLIAGLGIGGVALALAAQDTASNIIAAFMILLDRPFEVGDWVKVGDNEGSVEEFTFRSTRIRESANCLVAIPNSTVVNSPITNWSKLKKRRILIELVLEFDTPLKKVADVQNDLLVFMDSEENIIKEGMYVKFNEIKDDGFNLKLFCYTPIINYVDYMEYMDKVNFQIMSILNKNKVDLAYTSRTIYLKNIDKKK